MKNVMVCVTQQKNCERLIKYGNEILENELDVLHIIHVAHYDYNFLGKNKDNEALEYLYEKSLDYDANLSVVRSKNVLETLVDLIEKNSITDIILGKSNESSNSVGINDSLKKKINENINIIIIP